MSIQRKLDQPYFRFLMTAVIVSAAFLLRQVLVLRIGLDLPPFITLYPTIVVVAVFFGLWPGLLATALSAVLVDWWIMPPVGSLTIANPSHAVTLALFFGTGVFISLVADGYRRNHRRIAAIGMNEAVNESDARLAAVVETAPVGIMIHGADGRLLKSNLRARELLGVSDPAGRGLTDSAWQFVREDGSAMATEDFPVAQVLRHKAPLENFILGVRREEREQPVWVLVKALPRFAGDGTLAEVVVALMDITERKRAEEALRQSEKRYHTLFEAIDEGFCVIEVLFENGRPNDWRYLEVNSAFEKQNGVKQATGKTIRELAPNIESRWFDIYGRVAVSGEAARVVEFSEAFGCWWDLYAFRVGEPEQRRVAVIFNDITERKQIEEALRQSEERLRMQMERMPIGCIVLDKHNRFSQLNPAAERILGYADEELRGQDANLIVPSAAHGHVESLMLRLVAGDMTAHSENENLTKDGRTIQCQWTNTPLRDGAGNFIGLLSMVHDITERKRAEEALRLSEEKFRLISTNSPDILAIQDRDLRYEFIVNPPLGWDPAETIGKTDRELLDPEQFEKINALKQTVMNTGQAMRLDLPLRNERGETRFYEGAYIPRRDAPRTVTGVLGYFRDITERKQAEQALRESEERVRVAVEAAELGTWDLDLVSDIAVRSLRHDRIWGYTEAQPKWGLDVGMQNVVPEDRQLIEEAYERGIRSGVLLHENRIIWPDGSIHWILVNGRFQYDDNGRPIRVIGVVADITDRKRAEEALQNNQKRMAAIIGSAMDAVITVGADQRIQVFNAAAEKIFGCSAAEAIGKSLDRFIPAVHREDHRMHVEGFASTGTTSRSMHSPGILFGLRANGEEFPLEATISQVTVSGERLCTVILRDVTQRLQTEQALIRSEKLASFGRMAATIAHEINNPLAAVTNSLFLAATVKDLPDSARQYLEIADEELRRVAHITRQSLGFYRESNAPALTSVGALLESTVDLLMGRIKAKAAVIEKQWDGDVVVTAVAGELRQVFSNLLSNSLDAIEQKGTVTLRVSIGTAPKNGHRCVRVTIADNGKGIPASSQPLIFEPFFTTKGATGTGLGLWVGKEIIDKHHGTIRVRSTTQGVRRGTVFSIVLPVEPATSVSS